ncbi:MAG TPA: hypothetical protein DDX92_03190 [Flavobacteriales bacterium]|jgi:hypothetical protein|nr:hypothetical protein [Flavobacteriales bacterium]
MKKYRIPIVALTVLAAFSLQTCKHCNDPTNPDCANYDPCYGKKTINTFFKVRPGDRGFPPPEEWCDLVNCDTFNTVFVRFDIPEGNPENSTYEWQIGEEPEPRYGEGFEIEFGPHIAKYGWETWLPITLTIRTPPNGCLTNPGDTLISVTRELFFTEKALKLYKEGEDTAIFKGYFEDDPNGEAIIQYIRINEGSIGGVAAPTTAIVGVPFVDTLVYPRICYFDNCANHLHTKSVIYQDANDCYKRTKYPLSEAEFQFLGSEDEVKLTWVQNEPGIHKRHVFIGARQ